MTKHFNDTSEHDSYDKTLSQLAELDGVNHVGKGKVRDIFSVGDDQLLLVASDRVSAFDEILPTLIPDKGKILTGITKFWLDFLQVKNHLLSTDINTFGHGLAEYKDVLEGRSMLCKKADVISIECVARGYLVGSGWAEYQQNRAVCGVGLPEGLQLSEKLPEPIFTPAYKAPMGEHDENINFQKTVSLVGEEIAKQLKEKTLDLYSRAAKHAESVGILLADTKFEFGIIDGEVTLIDEVCTPDSSRFWPAAEYEVGKNQNSFDKQFIRDWVKLNGTSTPLPDEIVEVARERYIDAYEMLSGNKFSPSGN